MRSWIRALFRRFSPSQVLVAGFAGLILIGSFLLSLPIAARSGHVRWLDALFTSTSAVCVTGLIVADTGTTFSTFGQLVIIILSQIGGLGFMTMSTMMAILLGKRIGLRERLLIQESLGQSTLAGMVRIVRQILLITFAIEALGGIILSIRFAFDFPVGQAIYLGFFHSVSAFCNAGFDVLGAVNGPFTNLTPYVTDAWISLTIAGLIIIGGLGFPVIFEFMSKETRRRLSLHTRLTLLVTAALLAFGTLAFLWLEFNNSDTLMTLNGPAKILASFFQSVTPRTAGFNTLDYSKMRDSTIFLTVMLMFIGASPSSTGGGIKTVTFGVLMAAVFATIRGREDAELYERRLPKEIVYKAFSITVIALALVVLVTMLMSIVENFSFIRILFEVASAFGTVGLSTGVTPLLSDFSRVLLMLTMFAGRVGILTIAVALTQRLQAGNVRYMEDRVMIG